VWGFGRAIALWRFNAVQQFRADSDIDLCRKVLIAALALMTCSMQIALPNRTTFQLPAMRGLVQVAEALIEHSKCIGGSAIFGQSGVMLTQAIRQCRVSRGCSGVATAFCPDPFIELQLARELNHGPLLSWAEEPLLAPPRVMQRFALRPSSWAVLFWQALAS
jgi:hypothetical protein